MSKQTMGKDRDGNFHPGKGKPSGINKEEGLGLQPTDPENLQEYMEMTDKYTESSDELAPNVPLRHPNRNTSKGEDVFKGKLNEPGVEKHLKHPASEEVNISLAEELPGVLTKNIFTGLATYTADCCVSAFLGTQPAGSALREGYDLISFKNLLQNLEKKLKEKNIQPAKIDKMLLPGYQLLKDEKFWEQQSPGLGIFMADGFFKYIRMPLPAEEDVVIETSFYVTPLIPIMLSREYFYLLVVSKKQCKLFRGDAFNMEYIPVEGLPNGIGEEIGDTGVETTFRTNGNMGANFHGQGGGNNNDDKVYIANYLESVDDVIWKQVLHDETAPLVLAGVEYLLPIYKSVCDYNNVWEEGIRGSHEYDDTTTLYNKAKEIIEPYFQQRVRKALEMYGNQSATALTSSILDDVIPATYYSRVSHLFVQKGEHVWGKFDEMENKVTYSDEHDKGAQDLIDNAVVKTLMSGGDVFLLEKDKMPAESALAAIFRY